MGSHRETLVGSSVVVCACESIQRIHAYLRARVGRLYSDERGQATLEYILILSATVVGAGLMSRKIIQVLDTGIVKLGGQMEKDLKTGRAPLSVWKN